MSQKSMNFQLEINIVLFAPEIPQNTANIMRTAKAINAKLHIIEPVSFNLDLKDPKINRASAGHSKDLIQNFSVYQDFDDFMKQNNNPFISIVTRYGNKTYNHARLQEKVFLVFGRESKGIEPKNYSAYEHETLRIPMTLEMRSINLANAVSIVVYDVLSKNDFKGLITEPN